MIARQLDYTRREPAPMPLRVARRRSLGVVGAGNSARALSCYLAHQGHEVHLYARNPAVVQSLDSRQLRATGKLEGTYELGSVGRTARQFTAACSTIFVCTTANAYQDVMSVLGPSLESGHEIVLFSSKFGGSLEVEQCLKLQRRRNVRVVETDALFACRTQEDGSIWIRGFKDWNLYASPRCSQTHQNADILAPFFPNLEPAQNIVQRGLTDFGALAHALTVLVNMNRIDRQDPFLFYYEGFTDRTVRLLEALEKEFRAVAESYGTTLIAASELLNRYYGCRTSTLLEAMQTVPNYRFSQSPASLQTRYLTEDVPCTLVPVQGLARLAGLVTPVLDSVITLASVLSGEDYSQTGRTLERLGWGDYGYRDIVQWMSY